MWLFGRDDTLFQLSNARINGSRVVVVSGGVYGTRGKDGCVHSLGGL